EFRRVLFRSIGGFGDRGTLQRSVGLLFFLDVLRGDGWLGWGGFRLDRYGRLLRFRLMIDTGTVLLLGLFCSFDCSHRPGMGGDFLLQWADVRRHDTDHRFFRYAIRGGINTLLLAIK